MVLLYPALSLEVIHLLLSFNEGLLRDLPKSEAVTDLWGSTRLSFLRSSIFFSLIFFLGIPLDVIVRLIFICVPEPGALSAL